jgi:galactose oxidase
MANLGNAWHLPANPEPRGRAGMRDPVFPTTPVNAVTISTGNQFQGGGNAGNQLQDGSMLLFKRSTDTNWIPVPLIFATAIGNNKYYSAAGAPAAQPHVLTVSAPAPEHPAPRDVVALHEAVVRAATGTKVVAGLTGTCPYGIAACWGGANEALARLEGVEFVDPIPDGEASTATVFLSDDGLPSLDRWREQFRSVANDSYVLRGIEVTLAGTIEARGEELFLDRGDRHLAVRLAPLNPANKVQWDRPARVPQAMSLEEATAYAALVAEAGQAHTRQVTVTGPLRQAGAEFTLEVREVGTGH